MLCMKAEVNMFLAEFITLLLVLLVIAITITYSLLHDQTIELTYHLHTSKGFSAHKVTDMAIEDIQIIKRSVYSFVYRSI